MAGTNARTDGPSSFPNTGGIICLYTESDANAKFYLEKAKCKTPVITFDNVTSKVTITADDDETIYYTTDGSNPDANSAEYSEPFVLNAGAVIKAISKKDGIIDSEIATRTVEKLAIPTITFNEETREATITAAEGVEIYYTTNDTDPTIEETTAHAASPVVIAHALPSTKIHAQAVKNGSINSDVVTKTDIPAKVITNPTIILAEDEFVYDGSAKEPAISVKDGDVIVSADEYVVTYSSNTNAGTASVTVADKADGDYQVNDGSKTFTISPKTIGDGNTAAEGITVEMTEDGSLSAVKDGSTTLVENTDYTQETVEEGSDKIITITGIGNYTGIVKGIYASPQFDDPDGDGGGQAAAVYLAKRDLSCPTGIDPYIIRKVNPSIGTAVISKLDYIPVDVPVLLLSDDEVSGFAASPKDPSTPEVSAQTINSNLLKVSAGGETVEAAQIYMFYKGEFVLTKAGTLKEGKFYLNNPNYTDTPTNENSGNSEARGLLQFVIEDEETETTGIYDIRSKMADVREDWHTLDGRILNGKPTKPGLYIRNGRKTIIKRK
ncbi:MAG: chitobiase/beta-hexosaminidase C-terminal domain-containing protein [Prevotella sp.]|nr:chitobiase/beta-hexosaminidase C-terminal domain-containing protein [Prevotella sp.]